MGLSYETSEVGFGALISRAFGEESLTFRAGLFGEAVLFIQTEASDREPDRRSWAGAFGAHLGLDAPLFWTLRATAAAELALYAYRSTNADLAPEAASDVVTRPTYRLMAGVVHAF